MRPDEATVLLQFCPRALTCHSKKFSIIAQVVTKIKKITMKVEEFIEKFKQLKAEGFIPSTRKGPTGIGHTLETYLGMTENNIALPDIHEVELKAHRTNVKSLIALFTFNNKVWKMPHG